MDMIEARLAQGRFDQGAQIVPLPRPVETAVPELQVGFALPAPALRPLITTYYQVVAPGPLTDYLHPEWGNIRFTTRGSWQLSRAGCPDPSPDRHGLFGPSDRTATVTTQGQAAMVGVGLTSLGWNQLLGVPANLHANRMRPLSDVLGDSADALWQRLCALPWAEVPAALDEFFLARASAAPPADPMIETVQAALIDGNIDTAHDFAASLGVNDRTLARLCLRVFGFAPKRLLRRQRFLRTLADIGDRLDQPLASLLDGSYFDQPHFNREFRAYMGMTPRAYVHSPRQMMRRAAIERMRTAGAVVQGLHHIKAD